MFPEKNEEGFLTADYADKDSYPSSSVISVPSVVHLLSERFLPRITRMNTDKGRLPFLSATIRVIRGSKLFFLGLFAALWDSL